MIKWSHFVAFFRHLLYSFSELQIHPDEITFNSVLGACLQGILRSKNRGECEFSRLSCAITENAHASEVLQASVYCVCALFDCEFKDFSGRTRYGFWSGNSPDKVGARGNTKRRKPLTAINCHLYRTTFANRGGDRCGSIMRPVSFPSHQGCVKVYESYECGFACECLALVPHCFQDDSSMCFVEFGICNLPRSWEVANSFHAFKASMADVSSKKSSDAKAR